MQEKFRAEGKKLYFGYQSIEKLLIGFSEIRWAMYKFGVENGLYWQSYLCKQVQKTVVRTAYGNNNFSEIKISTHQGSALSPLLFVIVMEALSGEFRVVLPWELLYADDLVVIAETEDDLIKRLNE